MFDPIFDCIEQNFGKKPVYLHEPLLGDLEKRYLCESIDSGFVSSVGAMVDEFERRLAAQVGASHCVALVNGTAALQVGLWAADVQPGDEDITQPLTFIATANAIHHCGAKPVFIDIVQSNLSMSAEALSLWLKKNALVKESGTFNKNTGARIAACMPMHTFGLPADINSIVDICRDYDIAVVEDAAEALGSSSNNKHMGTFGVCGVFSFNGNKTITTGGGGALVTNDEAIANRVRHISTTAKIDAYRHDLPAYNFRMPNINAALGCAQLDRLESILVSKRELHSKYAEAVASVEGVQLLDVPEGRSSNYWLMTLLWDDKELKREFMQQALQRDIHCREAWQLLHQSIPYQNCQADDVHVAEIVAPRLLNLPSMKVA